MRKTRMPALNYSRTLSSNIVLNLAATLILSFSQPTLAQSQQRTFVSPGQASQALYESVRDGDDRAVTTILGSPELTSSGDQERDKLERAHFAQKYRQMHRLVRESDGLVVLYVGAENWPFPIPLVDTGAGWRFDSAAGSEEILARQVGENERIAIEVCQAIGGVNRLSSEDMNANNIAADFARKLVASDDANSAAGEVFHGYNFRLLKRASGETGVVAYPTEYRSSGVMTFILSRGTVYEKDLGLITGATASKIQGMPGGKWYKVQ